MLAKMVLRGENSATHETAPYQYAEVGELRKWLAEVTGHQAVSYVEAGGAEPGVIRWDAVRADDNRVVGTVELFLSDSTESREMYSSGAVRDTIEGRYDLIPPFGLQLLAETSAEGAAKYGDYNWTKGQPVATWINHALRHLNLLRLGDGDPLEHLAHAAWNCLAAIDTMRGPVTPPYERPSPQNPEPNLP